MRGERGDDGGVHSGDLLKSKIKSQKQEVKGKPDALDFLLLTCELLTSLLGLDALDHVAQIDCL